MRAKRIREKKNMNTYTFILHVEVAESAEGNTEEEAREELLNSGDKWKVEFPSGQIMMLQPSIRN